MNDTLEGMGRIAAGLTFDQAAAAALLGVIVTCIVSWGNSIVTLWGLKRSAASSEADRRAAVDVRDPSVSPAAAGTNVTLHVANVGETADFSTRLKTLSGGGVARIKAD